MSVDIDGIERQGEVRAEAIDNDPHSNRGDDRWTLVQFRGRYGESLLEWFPAHRLRSIADIAFTGGFVPDNSVRTV